METLWTINPFILVDLKKFTQIFPFDSSMSEIEKANAIARFTLYLSIALSLFNVNILIVVITCIIGLGISLIHAYYSNVTITTMESSNEEKKPIKQQVVVEKKENETKKTKENETKKVKKKTASQIPEEFIRKSANGYDNVERTFTVFPRDGIANARNVQIEQVRKDMKVRDEKRGYTERELFKPFLKN
tara:strand:- start:2261 stop:2827 length:567 start_codon:yes stop_codon:yes gene_type:complete